MGFFNIFKTKKRESAEKEQLTSICTKAKEILEDASDQEITYVSAFSGLLGRVAFSDLEISDEEISKIKKILKKTTALSEDKIDAISEIVQTEIKALAGLENHLYTAQINEIASKKQKEEIMVSLFLVAAADKNISFEENEEIRVISKALGFTHRDFVDIRSMFKEYLSSLQ